MLEAFFSFFSHRATVVHGDTPMMITDVRIKLMGDNNERLQAFCSVTFDDMFVIRDLKIIEGTKGPFVAMPSRKLTDRCPRCKSKNHLRARFCNQCGTSLDEERTSRGADGWAKIHADIAHPINVPCRKLIQNSVLKAFAKEKVLLKQPEYICRYDDYDDDSDGETPQGERARRPHPLPAACVTHPASLSPPLYAGVRNENRQFGDGILDEK